MSELEDMRRAQLNVEAQRLRMEVRRGQRIDVIVILLAVDLVATFFLLIDRIGW